MGFGGGITRALPPEDGKNYILIARTQPQSIPEGGYIQEMFPLTQELKDYLLNTYCLYAYDTVNRHHKLKDFDGFQRKLKNASVAPPGTTHDDLIRLSEGRPTSVRDQR